MLVLRIQKKYRGIRGHWGLLWGVGAIRGIRGCRGVRGVFGLARTVGTQGLERE